MAEITKNTFSGGMMKDLAPTNTSLTFLTDALNATITTNNGNELSLQNDLGNVTLPNLQLPHGYSPVGTCEYGGVIYVLSTNMETGHSLIGSLPSPEYIHNTLSGNDANPIDINDNDFFKGETTFNKKEYHICQKTEIIKKFTENYTLNPGDSFCISKENDPREVPWKIVPVLLKLDGTSLELEHSEIVCKNNKHSYISSKLSGKLGLKAKLPSVKNCGMTYRVEESRYEKGNNAGNECYKVTLTFEYNKDEDGNECNSFYVKTIRKTKDKDGNDKIDALFVLEDCQEFEVSNKELTFKCSKSTSGTFSFTANPIFIRGEGEDELQWIMKEEECSCTIDFDKINSNQFYMSKWKYYAYDLTALINIGLDLYPYLEYEITKVELHFYDNQGECAVYTISGRESYSGDFELEIPLSDSYRISELTKPKDANGNELIHIGELVCNGTINRLSKGTWKDMYVVGSLGNAYKATITYDEKGIKINDKEYRGEPISLDNSGQIQAGFIYGVKIKVFLNKIENPEANDLEVTLDRPFRWFLTNGVFNEEYYGERDDYEYVYEDKTWKRYPLTIELIPDINASYGFSSTNSSDLKYHDNNVTEYIESTSITINYKSQLNNVIDLLYNYGCFNFGEGLKYDLRHYCGDLLYDKNPDLQVVSDSRNEISTILKSPNLSAETSGYTSSDEIEYIGEDDNNYKTKNIFTGNLKVNTKFTTYSQSVVSLNKLQINILEPIIKKEDLYSTYGIDTNNNTLIRDAYFYCVGHDGNGDFLGVWLKTDGNNGMASNDLPSKYQSSYNNRPANGGEPFRNLTSFNWNNDVYDGDKNIIKYQNWLQGSHSSKNNIFKYKFAFISPAIPKIVYGVNIVNGKKEFGAYVAFDNYDNTSNDYDDNTYANGSNNITLYKNDNTMWKCEYNWLMMWDKNNNLHITNTVVHKNNKSEFVQKLASMLLQIYKPKINKDSKNINTLIYHERNIQTIKIPIIANVKIENGDLNFYNMKLSNYINSINNELSFYDIMYKKSSKVYPINYLVFSHEINALQEDYNTKVEVSYGDPVYTSADINNNKLYYCCDGQVNEINPELSFYKLDFSNGKETLAKDSEGNTEVVTSSEFKNIIDFTSNQLYLSHSSYNEKYDSYYSIVMDSDMLDAKERTGGWVDIRLDETLIDGYDVYIIK